MAESSNIPWEYIKLSQLMSSVKEDLRMYDAANLLDEDTCIKVIAKCNEKLGERILQSKQCKIIVEDYRGPKPSDLYQIENMFAINTVNTNIGLGNGGILGATQVAYTDHSTPKLQTGGDKIIPIFSGINTCSKSGCEINCGCQTPSCVGDNYCVSVLTKQQAEFKFKQIIPLVLSHSVSNLLTNYSPCAAWKGQYQVDMINEEFNFSFRSGEVYVSYLGNLVDEDGEILIPFHALLNDYYEYSVKAKLLEDIYINSEADVVNKLQFVKDEAKKAYYDAFNFIQTSKAGQWSKMRKARQSEYYNKWYAAF